MRTYSYIKTFYRTAVREDKTKATNSILQELFQKGAIRRGYAPAAGESPCKEEEQLSSTPETVLQPDSSPKEKDMPDLEKATPVEEKTQLPDVDWQVRDVLVGGMSKRRQMEVCLACRFYHIPVFQIEQKDFPIRYVALYQSKALFGAEAGITWYGEVESVAVVRRCDIRELPSQREGLYYRFEIKAWKKLPKTIVAKEIGFVRHFTNLFLLENSSEIPELWLSSEAEYRLYCQLKQAVDCVAIHQDKNSTGFSFNGFSLGLGGGRISLSAENRLIAQYEISDFLSSPNGVFRSLQAELEHFTAQEEKQCAQ